jgi:hypothetical protein
MHLLLRPADPMNTLTKVSSALLLVTATAIAAYLYVAPGAEGFDAARSDPQDAICKQDGERLARLRARPSLDEGLRFVGEIRCLQLWPQLQTLMDSLSDPSRSIASSKVDRTASDTTPGSDAASSPGATSATSDDACRHDEDRLAELRANPSVDAAILFDNELKCPRLKPQLLEILTQLSHDGGSVEVANRRALAPDTKSVSAAEPLASEPAASVARAAASEDACKQDEERLAALQAKPSLDEAVRLENEFTCLKLQPQLLALLDKLIPAPQSAGAPSATGASPSGTSAIEPAPQAFEPTALAATPAASDDPCKQDEERMAQLRAIPSSEEAARFAQELRCEALRPELLALTAELAKPSLSASVSQDARTQANATNETPPAPLAAADAERRIAQLESEKEALRAEVRQLQHEREASSAAQANSTPPPPATPADRSETPSASAVDAERRIAQLENEKEALTAKVSTLERDREALSSEHVNATPSPLPPAPAERSGSDPVAALASLPTVMPARVLIRYLPNNVDARAQAEMLASVLRKQGIEVADLRESRSAIRPELSFAYAPDEAIAQQVGRLVGVAPVRRPQPKDGLMVRPGTVELNLSGDSHLAAVKTTSTRESTHE